MGWLDDIRESLSLKRPEDDPAEADLELAAAVLMVEMARADQDFDEAEAEAIAEALRETFPNLSESVGALMGRARSESVDLTSFFPYVEHINEEWDRERKVGLLTQLWRVAQADGRIDRFEEHYLRRICELLNLPPKTFVQVREGFIE